MNNFPNFNFIFNPLKPNPLNPNQPAGANPVLPTAPNPVSSDIFKPLFQNTPQNEAAQNIQNPKAEVFTAEMAKMDNEVLLKYLQSTLKMPDSIEKFLKSADSATLKILVQNMVDTKALGEFLNQNSTYAIEKILKTISTSLKSGIADVSQLKDVLNILTSIQSQTNLNTNAIKELLLLYIPINPMVFDKQIDFSPASGEIEEKINNSTLSVIFETINFSNILCCVNSVDNTLYVELFADKIFPFDKFSKVINTVAKEMNFRAEVEPKIARKINSKEAKCARNFRVYSSGFVPTEVLLLATVIIKTVFKADETVENQEG